MEQTYQIAGRTVTVRHTAGTVSAEVDGRRYIIDGAGVTLITAAEVAEAHRGAPLTREERTEAVLDHFGEDLGRSLMSWARRGR